MYVCTLIMYKAGGSYPRLAPDFKEPFMIPSKQGIPLQLLVYLVRTKVNCQLTFVNLEDTF